MIYAKVDTVNSGNGQREPYARLRNSDLRQTEPPLGFMTLHQHQGPTSYQSPYSTQ